jgi:hypothetical protein
LLRALFGDPPFFGPLVKTSPLRISRQNRVEFVPRRHVAFRRARADLDSSVVDGSDLPTADP